MSAPKWTPGPWRTLAKAPNYVESPAGIVARVEGYAADGADLPVVANAHLIAAAPDQNAALESVQLFLDLIHGAPDPRAWYDEALPAIRAVVDAALALARGEEVADD